MNAPTKRQIEVYNFMFDFARTNGYPPTIREIASHFDIKSPNGVAGHINSLIKCGYLERKGRFSRAIIFLKVVENEKLDL